MKRSRSSEKKDIVIRKPFSSKHEPAASKCKISLCHLTSFVRFKSCHLTEVANISNLHLPARRLAPGFGIGALEELDVEDEDIYASG